MEKTYQPNWKSLRNHQTPQWFRDAKFGIYTHWGVYSVPATGPNGTWYPYNMYIEGTEQFEYHVKTYGHPSEFGYKEFIPMFTAEHFDADEWAELFKKAGARFAGPVAEHHDGFAMWDSAYTEWNAAKMGPKRDVTGELAKAIREQGMRFMVAMHHAENWWFFPHWDKRFDTADPRYSGLYGPIHDEDLIIEYEGEWDDPWNQQSKPSKEFLDLWKNKLIEVVEKYEPEYIWFDFGLQRVHEQYKQDFLAYYYNKGVEWGRGGTVVTYKWDNLPPGTAMVDLELGKMAEQTYYEWITDNTVDDGEGWCYINDIGYRTSESLIHYLIDNVSKNGYLLLNVGPKPDGSIPEPAKECLLGIGEWLEVNDEAIFDTVPWVAAGEGPTKMEKGGAFSDTRSDKKLQYTPEDIRFTVKDNVLYATCLGWPEKKFTIETLKRLYPGEVQSVQMLGSQKKVTWEMTSDGLVIERPDEKPCEHAFTFKITRNKER
jgi:alpha-L-fucosidase